MVIYNTFINYNVIDEGVYF